MSIFGKSYTFLAALLVAGALCFAEAAKADVSARLDSTQIAESETVQLTIEVTGSGGDEPDLSPLDADFEILHRGTSSQVNILNGRTERFVHWTLVLRPKKAGQLQVPAITVGSEKTEPINLVVTKAAGFDDGGTPNIFVETEVDQVSPYVQGMVRYTIKVFVGVRVSRSGLSTPELDSAVVLPLGQDTENTVTRNGRDYVVLERRFAIFPQESGALTIPAPAFEAIVPDRRLRGSPLFPGRGRRFRVTGKDQALDVRARPPSVQERYWLPARSLELEEVWEPDTTDIEGGKPLTRTITIRAVGLTGEQLPDLEVSSVSGLNVYPDTGKADTQNATGGIVGTRTQNIAYVPARPGDYEIPGVKVTWWDTAADKARVAELPARTVTIRAAAGSVAAPAAGGTDNLPGLELEQETDGGLPSAPALSPGGVETAQGPSLWMWVSAGLAVLWLSTLGLWVWDRTRRTHRPAPAPAPAPKHPDGSGARGRFLSACQDGDAGRARRDLMVWAGAHWPEAPPSGLEDLAGRLETEEQKALVLELNRALYKDGSQKWDGGPLARALTKLPSAKARDGRGKDALPELYG